MEQSKFERQRDRVGTDPIGSSATRAREGNTFYWWYDRVIGDTAKLVDPLPERIDVFGKARRFG